MNNEIKAPQPKALAKWWDKVTGRAEQKQELEKMRGQVAQLEASSRWPVTYSSAFAVSFDGEKSMGGIGPAYEYAIDYGTLRARSWQAYLDSEIAQTVINKYVLATIGAGLRLECEPSKDVLESEGFTDFNEEEFERLAEARYNLYARTTAGDYADMVPLNKLAARALKNAIIGGDVLVVQRYINGQVKVQLIDGAHVCNPVNWPEFNYDFDSVEGYYKLDNGNRVAHGVETDAQGRHIAYYVAKGFNSYERIEARDKTNGHRRAFLVYGLEYRLDNKRGIPLISAVMEKLKKMERYEDAVLSGAEERANMPFYIKHDANSTGENPFTSGSRFVEASGIDPKKLPVTADGEAVARKVSVSMERTVHNMPVGATLAAVDSDQPTQFKDYFTSNIDLICATLGIPPNVAMSKYDSNYSSSRAAIKEWEQTLIVCREEFSRQFYKPNYEMWLDIQVLQGKIEVEGYLSAKAKGNVMALAAIRNARFAGAPVPHIDPMKEVTAIRAKLGALGADIPLISPEEAAEMLNGGEINNNILKLSKTLEEMKNKGMEKPADNRAGATNNKPGDDATA